MTVRAFKGTTVALDKSMRQTKKVLAAHDITETRYTESGTDDEGRLIYEFVHGVDESRRGVRIVVRWRGDRGPEGGQRGSSPEMAGRALFWFIKAKFDSIDYGIEEFDVAFMPHLVTALGPTFAEQPEMIAQVVENPDRLALAADQQRYALPAGEA